MEYNGAKKRDFHQNYTTIVVFLSLFFIYFAFSWNIIQTVVLWKLVFLVTVQYSSVSIATGVSVLSVAAAII